MIIQQIFVFIEGKEKSTLTNLQSSVKPENPLNMIILILYIKDKVFAL